MSAHFRGNEESDLELQAWLSDIRRNLQAGSLSDSVAYARGTLHAELGVQGGSAQTVLTRFLSGIYATGWIVRKAEGHRRRRLLQALGCDTQSEKVFLDLLNRFWPPPTDREERKRVQTRHSAYARALEGAMELGIKPPDLAQAIREHGGLEGLARLGRELRKERKAQENGSEPGLVRPTPQRPLQPRRAPNPIRGGGRGGGGASSRGRPGFSKLNLDDPGVGQVGRSAKPPRIGSGTVKAVFSAEAARRLGCPGACLCILHDDENGDSSVRHGFVVERLPNHQPEDDQELLDEILRYLASR